MKIPRAVRRTAKNFMVGFGSIINTKSRAASDANTADAAPCRVSAEFGYVRERNFQASFLCLITPLCSYLYGGLYRGGCVREHI